MDYAAHFKKWNYEGVVRDSIIIEPNNDIFKIGTFNQDLDALMFCTNYMHDWWQKYSDEYNFRKNKITLEKLCEIDQKNKPIREVDVFYEFNKLTKGESFSVYSFNTQKRLEFRIPILYKNETKVSDNIEITRNEDNKIKIIISRK